MKNKKKMLLIDGQGMIYRSFYALPSLATSHGKIVNAVYGFTTMLIKLLEQENPDYIMVALDTPVRTFRHEKYIGYKAHRKKMPTELIEQIPLIKQVISNYNILIYEKEGYEADDIIGTIAKNAEDRDINTIIVTGDRDAYQLISDNTRVMMMVKGITVTRMVDLEEIKQKYGVSPGKIVDIMALKGDASDNIPGVPGIGEKTAISLIGEYGCLDTVIRNIEQIPKKALRIKIKENIELAKLSKELATIKTDVPIDYSIESFKIKDPDYEKLWENFKECEFENLVKKIEPFISQVNQKINYQMIDTLEKLKKLHEILINSQKYSFSLLKSNEKIANSGIQGISICVEDNQVFYIPLCPGSLLETNHFLPTKTVFDIIGPFFENGNIVKIGHNLKDDAIQLQKNGVRITGDNNDVMIASYLLNPSSGKYKMEDIIWEYLKISWRNHDKDLSKKIDHCCEIAQYLYKLMIVLEEKLKNKRMFKLFREIEMPLVPILGNMEITGIKVDVNILKKMADKLNKRLIELRTTIYQIAGAEFNINSPKQLSKILFEKLNLPVVKKTKTGYSTNSDVLNILAPKHEIIAHVLEYRELEKLNNTYISKLPLLVHADTNRIHTSFHQTIASTGRLSSSEPNLQNIPIRTEIGREIRKAFIAEKEHFLLSADYSQIELRILAHLSRDKKLIAAFTNNEDIHSHTAMIMFGIGKEHVTYKMRRMAKIINFGIIYGMGAYGLARNLGINRIEAENFIQQYFLEYCGVRDYIEMKKEEAREKGYVLTLLNRRRYVPEINHKNRNIREFNERIAINAPIQGTAADLIKIAMISIEKEFEKRKYKSKMVLQIHDELIFEIVEKELTESKKMIKEIMENSLKLSIPLLINLKSGKNWAELN